MVVKIYSTPACPWCKKLKSYLEQKHVKFEELDVSSDRKALKDMVEKSGQMGVPQVEIGNKIIVGFDKNAIDRELRNAA